MDSRPASRQGRPRRYDLGVPQGELHRFANPCIALAAAALDELRERVIDQIEDLPEDALTFVPEHSTLSIAALVQHLVWAEVGWVQRLSSVEAPGDLQSAVADAGRAVPAGERVIPEADAAELVRMCHRVREELTLGALAPITEPETKIPDAAHPMTVRGVLMHLIWHWTYHSGQIGLLRELWGSGYTWTFGSLGSVEAANLESANGE